MTSKSLNAANQRRAEKTLQFLWGYVFAIAHFAFEELSPEDRDHLGPENEEIQRATKRWLDKLYSMHGIDEVRR